MQLLLSADDMIAADRAAIERCKIPGVLLMENAGRAFVEALASHFGNLRGRRVIVACGGGNNGGDGFVIARHLINRGCSTVVLLCAPPAKIAGDAKSNLATLRRLAREKQSSLVISAVRTRRDMPSSPAPDIIVDALFGTGFRGAPRGLTGEAIAWINSKDCFVASVDIPSGVEASTGMAEGQAVEADLTVTMGAAKIGHFCGAGSGLCGELVVADIGIPHFVITHAGDPVFRVEEHDVRAMLPERSRSLHKYSAGKVFLLAGSRNFTGAACLAAEAVLRSGAGAVRLGIPASIHSIVAKKLTEVVIVPLPETPDGSFSREAQEEIRKHCAWADAVALGPGLSRNAETMDVTRDLLRECGKTVVVDADALSVCGGNPGLIKKRKAPTILTPHAGEMAELALVSAPDVEHDRVKIPRAYARATGSIVVLKGSPTATALPGGEVLLNSTGNPGMATIGSGDVLTGLIAGLCAQSIEPSVAAAAGVWIHGRAGDLAADRLGQRSVMAADILSEISSAFISLGAS